MLRLRPNLKPCHDWKAAKETPPWRRAVTDRRKDRTESFARLRLADGIRQGDNHHDEGAAVLGRGCKVVKIQMKTIEELHARFTVAFAIEKTVGKYGHETFKRFFNK